MPSGETQELEINKETALVYQPSAYEGTGQSISLHLVIHSHVLRKSLVRVSRH